MNKETIEGNKTIAVFDGWQMNKYSHLTNKLHKIDTGEEVGISVNQLEYHSSWDWLMPVVEKIADIHYPDYWSGNKPEDAGEWEDCPYPRTFGMRDKEGNFMVRLNANTLHSAKTLIEATWLAVVDFIQFNNEQSNKKP